jgi:adenine specific DNA methylase Mod
MSKKKKETESLDASWETSPITERDEVLVEQDPKNGLSKMCIGSGFFTNEYPLNYIKHPDFKIEDFEEGMPELVKDLRFDDGESYWYPTTIRTNQGMVFPVGSDTESFKWCFAPVMKLTASEKKEQIAGEYEEKLDMAAAEVYDRFMEASKALTGIDLNELS